MPAGTTPKDRFTALDTLALVRELRGLGAAHVDKAYDRAEGGWSLTLRSREEGRRELVLVPGRFAALAPVAPDHAETLSPFARELRRLLTGARIEQVVEPAGERFLEIHLRRGDEAGDVRLALEMFGAGNLLVGVGEKIAAVATPRRWANRNLRIGAPYSRPPSHADPWTMPEGQLGETLRASRTDLARTLAARWGLGGPLAEEVLARAEIDGTLAAGATPSGGIAALHRALGGLRSEVGDPPRGFLYRAETGWVDATPYPSARWAGQPGISEEITATFSEAALRYFPTVEPAVEDPAEAAGRAADAERARKIEQQRQAIEALTAEVGELQGKADTILAHYAEVASALEKAEGNRGPNAVTTVLVDGREIQVPVAATPRESAQRLFEEAKRRAVKLEGARAALSESEAAPRPGAAAPGAGRATRTGAARGRSLWFEKFRWFVSSEGAVVVAGRDAPSNDLLVRRHLRTGDVYLHADLAGAASVIVKRPERGPPPTETTLREAGQWAVAYSKAWRAGLASASAFWVGPDQVSKQGTSGEFVARGAWVIHGTKTFLRDLPLELGLGAIAFQGAERWTVAPPTAIRAHGRVAYLLSPGEERARADVEVELVRALGLSRTVLQALLPAGGVTVRRA